ncbi:MAG: phosphoadenosine phosphosulfate reductase family protein, partial [Pseudomonadota bacterium]
LAGWDAGQIRSYMQAHDLPLHPLVAENYPSIGCAPCTTRVAPGEDARAGRWRGQAKTECGIHFENGTAVRAQPDRVIAAFP